jgi:hypothetical protein
MWDLLSKNIAHCKKYVSNTEKVKLIGGLGEVLGMLYLY